jgi:hypothetical protein
LKLLFVMAHWHGLAKLRMHNDLTLDVMDVVTVSLGDRLRAFSQDTCAAFDTKELPREADARVRRETKQPAPKRRGLVHAANADASGANQAPPVPDIAPVHSTIGEQPPSVGTGGANPVPPHTKPNARRRKKTFNLNTYKLHSFGDYVATIRQYGTMDSYSTEPVRGLFRISVSNTDLYFQGELEHRSPKSRYTRTSRKHFIKQLTQIERRQARIRRIRARHQQAGTPAREEVAFTAEAHHVIGKSQNYPENIPNFLQKYAGDPAVKVNQSF